MTTISLGGGPSVDERRSFAGLRTGTHVPGYRGYIPQIKYQVGKTYGGDTHQLHQLFDHKKSSDLAPDSGRPALKNRLPAPTGDNKYTNEMIPGYTGYIPRRPFRFGGTYKEDCDVCIDEHLTGLRSHSSKMGQLRGAVSSYPRLEPLGLSLQDTKERLDLYQDTHPRQPLLMNDKRPLLEPPMPGYQGYIPRISSTELGLGCRYHQTTKNGLQAFKAEMDLRQASQAAPVAIDRLPMSIGEESNRRLYNHSGMIPKYTGYVPQRRYHFGQTYGNTTRSLDVCSHGQPSFGHFNKGQQQSTSA